MNTSFLQELLGSIAERSRALIDRQSGGAAKLPDDLEGLTRALLSGRGEASGVALAKRLLDCYAQAPVSERLDFFRLLARDFDPDRGEIGRAWEAYDREPDPASLQRLLQVVEPPRQELLRRLNLAPGGTAALVRMREDLIRHGGKEPLLKSVDDDFDHLFA